MYVCIMCVYVCIHICIYFSCNHLCSCSVMSDPMDCSPPGFSVHRVFQARILSELPFPPPGDHPDPGIKPVSPGLLCLLHYRWILYC